jgi:TolA-binding protein
MKKALHMTLWTVAVLLLASALPAAADSQSEAERYAAILAEADSLARNNDYVSSQLQSQEEQAAQIEQQIEAMDGTAAEVDGLIQRMYAFLEEFIAKDLPFRDPTQAGPDSRAERLDKLRELMADENTSNGEKYRRLVEAYEIELDYGRNMVAYKGQLDDGRDADFLRVGRVSLMYRTADGKEAGYWDAQQGHWVVDNDYNKAIEEAVLIATKESAPDLVALPVPAPQEDHR